MVEFWKLEFSWKEMNKDLVFDRNEQSAQKDFHIIRDYVVVDYGRLLERQKVKKVFMRKLLMQLVDGIGYVFSMLLIPSIWCVKKTFAHRGNLVFMR